MADNISSRYFLDKLLFEILAYKICVNFITGCESCVYRLIVAYKQIGTISPMITQSNEDIWMDLIEMIADSFESDAEISKENLIRLNRSDIVKVAGGNIDNVKKMFNTQILLSYYKKGNLRKANEYLAEKGQQFLHYDKLASLLKNTNSIFPEELNDNNLRLHMVPFIECFLENIELPLVVKGLNENAVANTPETNRNCSQETPPTVILNDKRRKRRTEKSATVQLNQEDGDETESIDEEDVEGKSNDRGNINNATNPIANSSSMIGNPRKASLRNSLSKKVPMNSINVNFDTADPEKFNISTRESAISNIRPATSENTSPRKKSLRIAQDKNIPKSTVKSSDDHSSEVAVTVIDICNVHKNVDMKQSSSKFLLSPKGKVIQARFIKDADKNKQQTRHFAGKRKPLTDPAKEDRTKRSMKDKTLSGSSSNNESEEEEKRERRKYTDHVRSKPQGSPPDIEIDDGCSIHKHDESNTGHSSIDHDVPGKKGKSNYDQSGNRSGIKRNVSSSSNHEVDGQHAGSSKCNSLHKEQAMATNDNEGRSITWSDDEDETAKNSSVSRSKIQRKKQRVKFSRAEEEYIALGVKKYGVGNWVKIKESFPFHKSRTNVNLKDKYRNMLKQGTL